MQRRTIYSIMTAGVKESGKSSFLDTLVDKKISNSDNKCICVYKLNLGTSDQILRKIHLIDTPGFDSYQHTHIMDTIVDYLQYQYISQIDEESKIHRNPQAEDNRVHVLLYFIPSTGNGLKQKDIYFLKRVDTLVNIIPIISKADGLTVEEQSKLKILINEQIEEEGINVFRLNSLENIPQGMDISKLTNHIPFAVSSDVRGILREEDHSEENLAIMSQFDFYNLKDILISSFTETFIDYTNDVLYENFRTKYLEKKKAAEES